MKIMATSQQKNHSGNSFGSLKGPNPETVEHIFNYLFKGNEGSLEKFEHDTLSLLRKDQESAKNVDVEISLGGGYDEIAPILSIIKKNTGKILAQLKFTQGYSGTSTAEGLERMLNDGNMIAKAKDSELSRIA